MGMETESLTVMKVVRDVSSPSSMAADKRTDTSPSTLQSYSNRRFS